MIRRLKSIVMLLTLTLNACATAPRSALLGATIGAATGGLIGQSQSQNSQGATVGLAIGASFGALLGYLAYKNKEVNPSKAEFLKETEEQFPALTKPRLRAIWVPDKIEGSKYIRGHYIYVIEDVGSWSKD